MSYADLYRRLEHTLGSDARSVFLSTSSYLYLLNRIEYHEKRDAFEYREVGAQQ